MALKKFVAGDRTFFKPAENANAFVILAEPKEFKAQHPCYQGELKDVVFADLSVFNTSEKGADPQIFTNAQVENGALVNQLKNYLGEQVAVVITKRRPAKGGNEYWSFDEASAEGTALVEAYIAKREAALADAPDYLQ